MNFEWRNVEKTDFDIVDKWESEDIMKYICFDGTFKISEYYEMFSYPKFDNCMVALDDDKIVGILLYDFLRDLNDGTKSYNIQILIVDPALTNNGIGTKMIEDIIEANKDKCDCFRFSVERDNYSCQRICQKHGFAVKGKMKRKDKTAIYELRVNELNKKRK